MSPRLALLLVGLGSGCSQPLLTAARLTVAADAAIMEGERSYGEWDEQHQLQLRGPELARYREQQRPRVMSGFASLTAAAHGARQAVQLAASGQVDPLPAARLVCAAVTATGEASAAAGCQLAAVALADRLCRELQP